MAAAVCKRDRDKTQSRSARNNRQEGGSKRLHRDDFPHPPIANALLVRFEVGPEAVAQAQRGIGLATRCLKAQDTVSDEAAVCTDYVLVRQSRW